MIVKTLFASLPLVLDSIALLVLTVIIFAILGIQLFGDNLSKYCMNIETGWATTTLCFNDYSCNTFLPSNVMRCVRTLYSPNFSIESFSGFGWSVVNVFQIITLEGWSQIMYDLEVTTGFMPFLFSLSVVFIC
jgi:hypothetical protein